MKYFCSLAGLTILSFLILSQPLSAQKSYRLTTDDGLPSNTVWRVSQDANGFLWFATNNGLSKYDGQSFETFGAENGLVSKNIMNVFWQNDSTMIASSYRKGISVFNVNTLNVEKVVLSGEVGEMLSEYKGKFYDCLMNSILVSATWPEMDFKGYPENEDFIYQMGFIFSTSDKFFAIDNGVLMQMRNGRFESHSESVEKLKAGTVFANESSNWIGGVGYIASFDDSGVGEIITKGLPADGVVHKIFIDSKGVIYLSVLEYGLYIIENNEAKQRGTEFGIGDININSFFEDDRNNIWISTYGKGVVCFSKGAIQTFNSDNSLSVDEFNDFVFHPHIGMVAATSVGLFKVGEMQLFKLPMRDATEDTGFGYGNTYVSRCELGPEDEIFVEVPNYQGRLGTLVHDSISFQFIRKWVRKDNSDDYYAYQQYAYPTESTQRHVSIGSSVRTWTLHDSDNMPVARNIRYLAPGSISFIDSKGRHWYEFTNKGVAYVINDSIIPLSEKIGRRFMGSSLMSTHVRDNVRLIGTNVGLFVLDGDSFYESPLNDKIANSTIKSIIEDKREGLWIATNAGLDYFTKDDHLHWNKSDGLVSNQINCLGYDPDKDLIYVGSDAGLSIVYLEELLADPIIEVPTVFTNFSSRGVVFDDLQKIELEPGSNDVEISFSSLDFTKKTGKRYQYRLNGSKEKEWRNTTNTTLEFNSLESDNYTLEVRPYLGNGRLGKTKKLKFNIDKVFWKKPSFYLATGALLLMLLSLLFNRRLKLQKREQERELEIEKKIKGLEYQALSAMMNPHFIFNSLNSIQFFYNSKDLRSANDYLAQFAKLIRMNLDMADQATVPLEDELDRLELYLQLEQMRLGDIFDYQINIEPNVESDSVLIPSMMIQPYVENSIFHGIRLNEKQGKIDINIKARPQGYLTIAIVDNGIGINQSKAKKSTLNANHQSKGMKINAERIDILGRESGKKSSLKVEELVASDGTIAGTQVSIVIPDTFQE